MWYCSISTWGDTRKCCERNRLPLHEATSRGMEYGEYEGHTNCNLGQGLVWDDLTLD